VTDVADVPVAILCGGFGTRLGSLAEAVPKPLVPILGRPFLEHQVDLLAGQGFRRFVLLTGHRGDLVEAHFRSYGGGGLTFLFSREERPEGTGGALVRARHLLGDAFIVLNGDSYLAVDYRALLARLLASPPGVAGVLAAFRNAEPTADVEANNLAVSGETVRDYRKRGNDPLLTRVDAGAGAYRASLFGYFAADDPRPLSLEEVVWPRVIREGSLLAFAVPERPWDIGTPARLDAFSAHLGRRHDSP